MARNMNDARHTVLASIQPSLSEKTDVDDDDELQALRAAALMSKKSQPNGLPSTDSESAFLKDPVPPDVPGLHVPPPFLRNPQMPQPRPLFLRNPRMAGCRATFQRNPRMPGPLFPNQFPTPKPGGSNLIVIQTGEPRTRNPRPSRPRQDMPKPTAMLLRPQDKWSGVSSNFKAPDSPSKPKVPAKFSRYESSDSDSDDDDSDDGRKQDDNSDDESIIVYHHSDDGEEEETDKVDESMEVSNTSDTENFVAEKTTSSDKSDDESLTEETDPQIANQSKDSSQSDDQPDIDIGENKQNISSSPRRSRSSSISSKSSSRSSSRSRSSSASSSTSSDSNRSMSKSVSESPHSSMHVDSSPERAYSNQSSSSSSSSSSAEDSEEESMETSLSPSRSDASGSPAPQQESDRVTPEKSPNNRASLKPDTPENIGQSPSIWRKPPSRADQRHSRSSHSRSSSKSPKRCSPREERQRSITPRRSPARRSYSPPRRSRTRSPQYRAHSRSRSPRQMSYRVSGSPGRVLRRSMSPKRLSPSRRYSPQRSHSPRPYEKQWSRSPRRHSPRRSASPRRYSPHRSGYSPHRSVSPRRYSPRSTRYSPHRSLSPTRYSPPRRYSPHKTSLSPRRYSPHQSRSPGRYSPHRSLPGRYSPHRSPSGRYSPDLLRMPRRSRSPTSRVSTDQYNWGRSSERLPRSPTHMSKYAHYDAPFTDYSPPPPHTDVKSLQRRASCSPTHRPRSRSPTYSRHLLPDHPGRPREGYGSEHTIHQRDSRDNYSRQKREPIEHEDNPRYNRSHDDDWRKYPSRYYQDDDRSSQDYLASHARPKDHSDYLRDDREAARSGSRDRREIGQFHRDRDARSERDTRTMGNSSRRNDREMRSPPPRESRDVTGRGSRSRDSQEQVDANRGKENKLPERRRDEETHREPDRRDERPSRSIPESNSKITRDSKDAKWGDGSSQAHGQNSSRSREQLSRRSRSKDRRQIGENQPSKKSSELSDRRDHIDRSRESVKDRHAGRLPRKEDKYKGLSSEERKKLEAREKKFSSDTKEPVQNKRISLKNIVKTAPSNQDSKDHPDSDADCTSEDTDGSDISSSSPPQLEDFEDSESDSGSRPQRGKSERNRDDIEIERRRIRLLAREKELEEKRNEWERRREERRQQNEQRREEKRNHASDDLRKRERRPSPRRDRRSRRDEGNSRTIESRKSRSQSPVVKSLLSVVQPGKSHPKENRESVRSRLTLSKAKGRKETDEDRKEAEETRTREKPQQEDKSEDARQIIKTQKHKDAADDVRSPPQVATSESRKSRKQRVEKEPSQVASRAKSPTIKITFNHEYEEKAKKSRASVHSRLGTQKEEGSMEQLPKKRKHSDEKHSGGDRGDNKPRRVVEEQSSSSSQPERKSRKIDLRSIIGSKKSEDTHEDRKLEEAPSQSRRKIRLNRNTQNIQSTILVEKEKEDLLNERILKIQEKNEKILRRKKLVEKEKKKFG